MYQVKKEGFDQQLPFSPRQSIFSAPAFDDLIRSGNNLGSTPDVIENVQSLTSRVKWIEKMTQTKIP